MNKLLLLYAVLLFGACQPPPPHADRVPGAQATMVITDTTVFTRPKLVSWRSVRDFYQQRHDSIFWVVKGQPAPAVDSLLSILNSIEYWGLFSGDYHVKALNTFQMDSLLPNDLQKVDVLLSDAYITLYQHLHEGILDPVNIRKRDLSQISDVDAIASLRGVHQASLIQELRLSEPTVEQYALLKEALKEYVGHSSDSVGLLKNKILVNMERWRWEKLWPQRYLFVNIPAFRLDAVEGDSVWLTSAVVVGKRRTPTPVMESVVRSFTIYPYWHAPYSIATQEILPALKKDPSLLARRNFQVLYEGRLVLDPDTIQWERYSAGKFPFILRQREGSENTMGIIKFNFANGYNVYLHDTNSKALFGRARRDFSHGCVRVHRAVALAHYLVREDDIYVSPEDLDQYLSLQQRLDIELRKPIAIKLKYFTAEVHNGDLLFYSDIYGRDSLMIEALRPTDYGKAAEVPVF